MVGVILIDVILVSNVRREYKNYTLPVGGYSTVLKDRRG